MCLILSCIIQYYKTTEYKCIIHIHVYMCINATVNVCACHALQCLRPCMHAHMYTWHKCSCVHDDIYVWSMERQVISECLTVRFADSHMQVKCSNYKWVVCHNTLPLQLVVGVKGLLTVHTYSDCQQLPHSPGGSLKFKVERCCMNSQALQQSESENRWSHRLGLLGLVMFNGVIHLTCVLSIQYPIESQHSCN